MKKEHGWAGRPSSKAPVPKPEIMKLCQVGSHYCKLLEVFHKRRPDLSQDFQVPSVAK